jgi:hypothetical protein
MDDYTPDHDYNNSMTKGEHDVKIVSLEERTSRNGNRMLAVKLETEGGGTLFYNIVKNDWFNKNMTRFLDCFRIPTSVLNSQLWINRHGRVYVDKGPERDDGKQFMEVKYLIVPPAGEKIQTPVLTPIVKEENLPAYDGFADDIPF